MKKIVNKVAGFIAYVTMPFFLICALFWSLRDVAVLMGYSIKKAWELLVDNLKDDFKILSINARNIWKGEDQ